MKKVGFLSIVILAIIFSVSVLILDSNQTADAMKSKGTHLPEIRSGKVCGDKLCSEIDSEKTTKQSGSMMNSDYTGTEKKDYDKKMNVDSDERNKNAESLAMQHLKTFDELDFEVFTNQNWDRLNESHSQDIIVHWPDGSQTEGIERHIEDLKAMFVFAPDTRIQEHPVKIASGEWTSVIGVMEGTFTEPMPLPDGTVIPPTGKAFKLQMVTVGHWNNGVMDEEYLFWDNMSFMRQIGLGQ